MRGISWLADNRLASQEGLCSMEWVSKCYMNIKQWHVRSVVKTAMINVTCYVSNFRMTRKCGTGQWRCVSSVVTFASFVRVFTCRNDIRNIPSSGNSYRGCKYNILQGPTSLASSTLPRPAASTPSTVFLVITTVATCHCLCLYIIVTEFLLLHRAFWQQLCSYHQQMHFFITHIKC